ncbi:hypothetical protein M3J09_005548 [Ascochyta lentis]
MSTTTTAYHDGYSCSSVTQTHLLHAEPHGSSRPFSETRGLGRSVEAFGSEMLKWSSLHGMGTDYFPTNHAVLRRWPQRSNLSTQLTSTIQSQSGTTSPLDGNPYHGLPWLCCASFLCATSTVCLVRPLLPSELVCRVRLAAASNVKDGSCMRCPMTCPSGLCIRCIISCAAATAGVPPANKCAVG